MRQELRFLRRKLAGLPKTVGDLSRHVAGLMRERDAHRAQLQSSEQEVQAARFSPRLIKKLRARLKLTQGEVAKLVQASVAAVRAWEAGRSRPQGVRRAALVALRKLGRREVKRLLGAKAGTAGKPRARRAARRGVRRARRTRKTK
jgi:DNA-binding transcriptional regulator YiaG